MTPDRPPASSGASWTSAAAVLGVGLASLSVFLPMYDAKGAFATVSQNSMIQSDHGLLILAGCGGYIVQMIWASRSDRHALYAIAAALAGLGYAIALGRNYHGLLRLCPILFGQPADPALCTVAAPGIGVYVLGVGAALAALAALQVERSHVSRLAGAGMTTEEQGGA